MSDELVWEAPPTRETKSKYAPIAAELKKNPGRWARIQSSENPSTVANARAVFMRVASEPQFEARSGKDNEGGFGLWARYRTAEQMKSLKA